MYLGAKIMRRLFERSSARRKASSVRPVLEILENRLVPSADFVQTNLVSDIAGMAATLDANLINPWGLVASSSSPWWVANNGTGTSTLYNGQGVPQPPGNNPPLHPLIVTVPNNPNDNPPPPAGTPTGIVFNTTLGTSNPGFDIAKNSPGIFLFDTLDGTISGWNPGVNKTNAVVAVTQPGAVFTGLAIATDSKAGPLLYAADHKNGVIDVYDQNFNLVKTLPGNFSDPNLPADASPFNIQNINGKLYVEYTEGKGGTGKGFVDVFNTDGTLDTKIGDGGRLISGGALDNPWGIALAPATFGAFANDYLVGNFGDGHINAFDANGKFAGELMTSSGQPFEEDHLWSLQFGNNGGAGPSNTLFFTAGIDNEKHGLFGSLQAVPALPEGAPIVPNLGALPQQTVTTVASNGDLNPYGVAFVPQDFQGGGKLAPGDILVSNFNASSNLQATGSSIVLITPDGQQSTFFQGPTGLGLTTALGVLPQGFVLVGSTPAATVNTVNTVSNGGLIVLDSNGNEVMELSDSALLQGPWDLTINNVDDTHAQVFVSNVLSGTVTRIDLTIPNGGTPQVESETQIASGFVHQPNGPALVVGPTGLAFDAKTDTLYVSSTGDNAIYAIQHADDTQTDQGKGKVVVQDPQHLHGPLALALAPNGDLIASNGDAINPDPNNPNMLVEYTPQGKFVGQFQIDGGPPGAAFGLAVQQIGNQVRFAAVDDNTNTLNIWTYQTGESSGDGGGDSGGHGRQGGNAAAPALAIPSSPMSSPSNPFIQQIDAFFQSLNAALQSLESSLLAFDPQLSGLFTTLNADLDALEAMIVSKLS
jgi:uncharacterized protein (TIGR03118 family)